ncbi:hypothetical protein [Vibrio mediterranei]
MKVPVKTTDDGEMYFNLPPEKMSELGWKEGDVLEWVDNGDGSFSLTKL